MNPPLSACYSCKHKKKQRERGWDVGQMMGESERKGNEEERQEGGKMREWHNEIEERDDKRNITICIYCIKKM